MWQDGFEVNLTECGRLETRPNIFPFPATDPIVSQSLDQDAVSLTVWPTRCSDIFNGDTPAENSKERSHVGFLVCQHLRSSSKGWRTALNMAATLLLLGPLLIAPAHCESFNDGTLSDEHHHSSLLSEVSTYHLFDLVKWSEFTAELCPRSLFAGKASLDWPSRWMMSTISD
nr:hypothetical protein CFP56_19670 [Quercus suber]